MTSPVVIGDATLYLGDCIEVMRTLADNSVDAIVTDPPYELGFMGKGWDATGIANNVAMWTEALRVLKPGGHLLAFSGSRTYHRMTCAIEDAGFEVRDQIMWIYGSGFPKSLDVSKAIDKAAGAEREVLAEGKAVKRMIPGADQNATGSWIKDNGREYVPTVTAAATDEARQWEGWGTALKPAHEPICVARKPLVGTVAANVLQFGTGALNIDGCRVAVDPEADASQLRTMARGVRETGDGWGMSTVAGDTPQVVRPEGRWPANVMHDGSDEVLAAFPDAGGQQGAITGNEPSGVMGYANCYGKMDRRHAAEPRREEDRSAARFFYCAKASKSDRDAGLDGFALRQAGIGDERPSGSSWERRAPEKNPNNPRANTHPTVKPTDLMAYLCRLVTPPDGLVLDPFMGSGSTGKACMREGFRFVGIDMTAEYVDIAEARIKHEIIQVTQRATEAQESADLAARQPDLFTNPEAA